MNVTGKVSVVCVHTEDLCGSSSKERCSTSHLALPSVEGQAGLAPHRRLDSKVSHFSIELQ